MTEALWGERLATMKSAWSATSPPRPDFGHWKTRLSVMARTAADLRSKGLWQRGPTDLLTVCGLHRRELAQSAVLAWVLDPEARHGLGDRVLRALLDRTGELPDLAEQVLVDLELGRDRSRADVVVRGQSWNLIIEVKVHAAEGKEQCQRLYDDWIDDPDPRFVFLTRLGQAPTTAMTPEAQRAWIAVGWRDVLGILIDAAAAGESIAPGRPALEEWMRTLVRLYGKR